MHSTPTEWQMARVTYEWVQGFQFRRASLGERLRFPTNTAEDPLDLDEKVLLADKCTIPGFQSVITHGRTQRTMMMGHRLNIMTQAPYSDDRADLPNGLYVMRTYTELKDGSWSVSVVLWNLTARPIHLARGRVIGQVAAANAVPEAQCSPDLLEKLGDESEDKPEPTKLSMQQRQELLLAALEKDGGLDHLKDWLPELAKRAKALLLEFHHVFSLQPNKIGCIDTTKHVIELMKDEPFKERFHRIAPPLGGRGMPAYSGNARWRCYLTLSVALVQCHCAREKEGWVAPVLYRLLPLGRLDQKGCLSPATYAGNHGKHGGCPTLLLHGPEEWVLASSDGWGV